MMGIFPSTAEVMFGWIHECDVGVVEKLHGYVSKV